MEHDFPRDEDLDAQLPGDAPTGERERIRPSSDHDRTEERSGERPPRNQADDDASARGGDTDPDRARADVDRDDMVAD